MDWRVRPCISMGATVGLLLVGHKDSHKQNPPPRRLQPCVAAMPDVEALSRGAQAPQRSKPHTCNRTFVFCCRMPDTASLYHALGRRLYCTPGERAAGIPRAA